MSNGFWTSVAIGLIAIGFAVRWMMMWLQGRAKEISPYEYFVWGAIGLTMLITIIIELVLR